MCGCGRAILTVRATTLQGVLMQIITISREFGSGGRELGKRLADMLGFDYYDREIIAGIAANKDLDARFVENVMDAPPVWQTVSLTYGHSFALPTVQTLQTDLLLEQKKILEKIAQAGRNCVIVGRNADIILADYLPLSIFVCASMQSKVKRCIERADASEQLTPAQVERNIKRIDKGRSRTREIISGGKWGDRSQYNLIVNTTDWQIKQLVPAVAQFAEAWFQQRN